VVDFVEEIFLRVVFVDRDAFAVLSNPARYGHEYGIIPNILLRILPPGASQSMHRSKKSISGGAPSESKLLDMMYPPSPLIQR